VARRRRSCRRARRNRVRPARTAMSDHGRSPSKVATGALACPPPRVGRRSFPSAGSSTRQVRDAANVVTTKQATQERQTVRGRPSGSADRRERLSPPRRASPVIHVGARMSKLQKPPEGGSNFIAFQNLPPKHIEKAKLQACNPVTRSSNPSVRQSSRRQTGWFMRRLICFCLAGLRYS
jgi:hypothetical protein